MLCKYLRFVHTRNELWSHLGLQSACWCQYHCRQYHSSQTNNGFRFHSRMEPWSECRLVCMAVARAYPARESLSEVSAFETIQKSKARKERFKPSTPMPSFLMISKDNFEKNTMCTCVCRCSVHTFSGPVSHIRA